MFTDVTETFVSDRENRSRTNDNNNTVWCSVCGETRVVHGTRDHASEQRHVDRTRTMALTIIGLPNDLKYHIISFMYPQVQDYTTMCRCVCNEKMKRCLFEMRVRMQFAMIDNSQFRCDTCGHLFDYHTYERFKQFLHRHRMCLNCMFRLTTASNYFDSDEDEDDEQGAVYNVNGTFVHDTVIRGRGRAVALHRFARLKLMMVQLQQFCNRHDMESSLLDVSGMYGYATLEEYMLEMHTRASDIVRISDLYRISLLP